jgi:hypothetical protein
MKKKIPVLPAPKNGNDDQIKNKEMQDVKHTEHPFDISPETKIKINTGETAQSYGGQKSSQADCYPGFSLPALSKAEWPPILIFDDQRQKKNEQDLHQHVEGNLLGSDVRKQKA